MSNLDRNLESVEESGRKEIKVEAKIPPRKPLGIFPSCARYILKTKCVSTSSHYKIDNVYNNKKAKF